MANPVELMSKAVNAVPPTGTITYQELVDKLAAEGNSDAVAFIVEAKRRNLLRAKVAYVDGQIVHTYERA